MLRSAEQSEAPDIEEIVAFLRAAALADGHMAMMPANYCGPELRSGRLVRVLPGYTVGTGNMFLVHPAAKVLPAKARAFRDFLLEHLDVLTQQADVDLCAPAGPSGRSGRGRRGRAR